MKPTTLSRLARSLPPALFLLTAGLHAQAVASAPGLTTATPAPANGVVSLDPYEVNDTRPEPFINRNLDLPRTVNDVQPYIVFDAKTIEQSGIPNVEDFLRQRLTMNNVISSNSQNPTSYGTGSAVSLRGLGVTQTLILVDGRRLPTVYVAGSVYQGDLNGLPLGAIDRIEVLPSSASGIYGGGAVAGVVNIITKKNYVGGEVRMTYDTSFNTDDAIRTVSVSWGAALEGGKTHVLLSANYSSAHDLMLGDRLNLFIPHLYSIIARAPANFYTPLSPFQGATTNISSGTAANLVLKSGAALPSNFTHIPVGTTASTSATTLAAGLLQNAGSYDLTLAAINGVSTDTQSPVGFTPEVKGFNIAVTRQMTSHLEASVYFTYASNKGVEIYDGHFNQSNFTIPATATTNPFATSVLVKFPATQNWPRTGPNINRTFAASLKYKFPHNWLGIIDYTAAKNAAGHFLVRDDATALQNDLNSGALNPFVDERVSPINLAKYAGYQNFTFFSTHDAFTMKASGPLPSLPWGAPQMTFGVENRIGGQENGKLDTNYPLTPANSSLVTYYGFKQTTKAAYAEANIPLVRKEHYPLLYSLEAQVAARTETFAVATGTPQQTYTPSTGLTTFSAPVINGLPFRSKTTYTASEPTFGVKYQPVQAITIRASYAQAFLPPTAAQLIENPLPNVGLTTITDPKTNTIYGVTTIGGGNASLKPQSSKSYDFGFIWQPRQGLLKGLRFDAEYYRIRQFNAISALTAQVLLNNQSTFANRVTRDPSTGLITQVDVSSLNLYSRDQLGWDFTLDYYRPTPIGTFTLHTVESLVLHSRFQYSLTLPQYDDVGFPEETGGQVKYRINTTVGWEKGSWNASWTTRYYDRYHIYGGAGGGISAQNANGGDFSTYAAAQGGEFIAAQIYHDLTIGYTFGRAKGATSRLSERMLDGVSVQVGIKNVFNTTPAFDAGAFAGLGYISGLADIRLRDGWISVKKAF